MAQEIEAKYRLDDPAGLRERLIACGARRGTQVLEENRLFDTADRKLQAADCGLRVRTCRSFDDDRRVIATLTYKGPRAAGEVKIREELETTVTDPPAVAAILQRLGFDEVVRYEKRRESWRLDDCEVCLDELPQLGWFVEIEGPSVASSEAVAAKLGPHINYLVRETYVEMAAVRGAPGAQGVRCLQFE